MIGEDIVDPLISGHRDPNRSSLFPALALRWWELRPSGMHQEKAESLLCPTHFSKCSSGEAH